MTKLDLIKSDIEYLTYKISGEKNGEVRVKFENFKFTGLIFFTDEKELGKENADFFRLGSDSSFYDIIKTAALRDYKYGKNSIALNKEILNVIHAVRDYKRFLASYHVHVLEQKDFDTEYKAKEFFFDIVPENTIPASNNGFNAIIALPQETLDNLDMVAEKYLGEYYFKY